MSKLAQTEAESERLSSFQIQVLVWCGLIAMLDGFDTQSVAFVAPLIAQAWHVPPSGLGIIFSAGLLGGLLGAIVFGIVADRAGRRVSILATLAIIACGSFLTAAATSLTGLVVSRFLAGVGLGGAIPSITAIAAEYSPQRLRATLVTAMFCGFPLGAGLGALLFARVLASWGWRSVFVIGAMAPLLLWPLVARKLPESMEWLMLRGKHAQLRSVLDRMRRTDLPASGGSADGPAPGSFAGLFREGRALSTPLLWFTFFSSLLLVYLLLSWIPTIAVNAGLTPGIGALAVGIVNLASIAGSVLIGRCSDKFGQFRVVGAAYVLGGVLMAAIGLRDATSILLFCAAAGALSVGAQLCMVAVASNFYAIELRATGVGWAVGIGRIGAIVGPLVGAIVMGSVGPRMRLPIALGAISLAAGVAVAGMGVIGRRPGRPDARPIAASLPADSAGA